MYTALSVTSSDGLPHLCLCEGAPERVPLLLEDPLCPADLPQPLALGDGRVGGLAQLALQAALLLTALCYSLGGWRGRGRGGEGEGGGGEGEGEGEGGEKEEGGGGGGGGRREGGGGGGRREGGGGGEEEGGEKEEGEEERRRRGEEERRRGGEGGGEKEEYCFVWCTKLGRLGTRICQSAPPTSFLRSCSRPSSSRVPRSSSSCDASRALRDDTSRDSLSFSPSSSATF